jgi:hypothetical protein
MNKDVAHKTTDVGLGTWDGASLSERLEGA